MVDKPNMDEQLAQLDREWKHKHKELDDAWRRYLRNFAEETHRGIARVVGEAVATVVRDIESANKIAHAIKAGFARLRAIDDLRTACGVDIRPDRTTTPSTGTLLRDCRGDTAQNDLKETYRAGFDAGYDCAITEARQIVSDLAGRLAEDRNRYQAELKTLRANIEALQAKNEQSDPPTRPN